MNYNVLAFLLMPLIFPIIMLIFGILMKYGWPKEINGLAGFRTARAMESIEAWRFAHDLCGRLWYKWGVILLLFNIFAAIAIVLFTFLQCDCPRISLDAISSTTAIAYFIIFMSLHSLIMLATAIYTQVKLCQNFNKDGTRKNLGE